MPIASVHWIPLWSLLLAQNILFHLWKSKKKTKQMNKRNKVESVLDTEIKPVFSL